MEPTVESMARERDKLQDFCETLAAERDWLRLELHQLWTQIEGAEFEDIEDDEDLVLITVTAPQARRIRAALSQANEDTK